MPALRGNVYVGTAGSGVLFGVGLQSAGISRARVGRATGLECSAVVQHRNDCCGSAGEVRISGGGLLAGRDLHGGIRGAGGTRDLAATRERIRRMGLVVCCGAGDCVDSVYRRRTGGRGRGKPSVSKRDSLRPRDESNVYRCGNADGSASGKSYVLARTQRADALLLLLVRAGGGSGKAGWRNRSAGHDCQLGVVGIWAGGGVGTLLQELSGNGAGLRFHDCLIPPIARGNIARDNIARD